MQADALDSLLSELGQPLDAVVQMDVENGEIMRRISGRRTCADCGRVFNLFSTPAEQIETEKCPKTGEPHKLFQRPDDTEETVANRLKVYEEKTKPLIEFYRKKGVLQSINAEGDVDEISERLEKALQAAAKGAAGARQSAAKKKAAAKKKPAVKKTAGGKQAAVAKKSAAKKPAAASTPAAKKSPAKKTAAGKPAGAKVAGKATRKTAVRRRTTLAKSAVRQAKKAPARRTPVKKAAKKAKKVAKRASKR
jgi:adenylate kinase